MELKNIKIKDIKDIDTNFSYKGIDEVKSQKFNRKLLKSVYAKHNKMDSKKMNCWNMHTFSNISIPTDKITLLKLDNSYDCLDILLWMIKKYKNRFKGNFAIFV